MNTISTDSIPVVPGIVEIEKIDEGSTGKVSELGLDKLNAIKSTSNNDNNIKNRSEVVVTPSQEKHVSESHYERLVEELKCPGCANPMKSPIRLCLTGHSVCDACTRLLRVCPLCKESFTSIRSLTLEALSSKAHFRCQNASSGCTVRLQTELLDWHEKQCMYKTMKCFMGRVWGDCTWIGLEEFWKDHLQSSHSDKILTDTLVELQWDLKRELRPLASYYVFEVYGEMFNFYQIHDKDRVLWTMACTSTVKEKKLEFSYDVELYNPEDESAVINQRFRCHSEYDKDILQNGTCISIHLIDISRLLNFDRILNYRVRVNQTKPIQKLKSSYTECKPIPINFKQTHIEGVNMKHVPSAAILTRKLSNLSIIDAIADDEASFQSSSSKALFNVKDDDSDSEHQYDPIIQTKWSTPQLNFNRKFLKDTLSSSSESCSSSNQSPKEIYALKGNKSYKYDKKDAINKLKMRKMTNSLRKSLKHLKTDLVELKSFAKRPPSPSLSERKVFNV